MSGVVSPVFQTISNGLCDPLIVVVIDPSSAKGQVTSVVTPLAPSAHGPVKSQYHQR